MAEVADIKYRAVKWLQSRHTGTSSLTIWRTLMHETPERVDVPHDPDDFSRCYDLLKAVPEWRERLSEVADLYAEWRPFVDAWDELTRMYEHGGGTRWKPPYVMYARMKQLRDAS